MSVNIIFTLIAIFTTTTTVQSAFLNTTTHASHVVSLATLDGNSRGVCRPLPPHLFLLPDVSLQTPMNVNADLRSPASLSVLDSKRSEDKEEGIETFNDHSRGVCRPLPSHLFLLLDLLLETPMNVNADLRSPASLSVLASERSEDKEEGIETFNDHSRGVCRPLPPHFFLLPQISLETPMNVNADLRSPASLSVLDSERSEDKEEVIATFNDQSRGVCRPFPPHLFLLPDVSLETPMNVNADLRSPANFSIVESRIELDLERSDDEKEINEKSLQIAAFVFQLIVILFSFSIASIDLEEEEAYELHRAQEVELMSLMPSHTEIIRVEKKPKKFEIATSQC